MTQFTPQSTTNKKLVSTFLKEHELMLKCTNQFGRRVGAGSGLAAARKKRVDETLRTQVRRQEGSQVRARAVSAS